MAFNKVAAILAFIGIFALGVNGYGPFGDPCAPDCLHEHTGTYFPHPQNCSEYFYCSHLVAHYRFCPAGLHFNPTYFVCDYPETAGCTADPDFDCEDGPPTLAPVTTEDPDIGDPCAPDCTTIATGTKLPHPQNCSLFFTCSHGLPYLHNCPHDLEFNTDLNVCDYPEDAGCTADPDLECGAPAPVPTTTTTTPVPTTTTTTTTTPAPTTTTTTTTTPAPTTTTTTTTTTTPAPTTTTTTPAPTTTTTTAAPTTTTTESSGICLPGCPSKEAIYPYPHDCTKWVHCAHHIPHIKICPDNLEFWAEMQRCDYPELAQCTLTEDSPCVAVTQPPV